MSSEREPVGVIGVGWVGLVTAVCFAELGHEVVARDILPQKVESLSRAWGWSAADRTLLHLPLHHVHGIINVLTCALWSGARCTIHPGLKLNDRTAKYGEPSSAPRWMTSTFAGSTPKSFTMSRYDDSETVMIRRACRATSAVR